MKRKRSKQIAAKGGKSDQVPTTVKPMKQPGRTTRQVGGLRASLNRGGKKRVQG